MDFSNGPTSRSQFSSATIFTLRQPAWCAAWLSALGRLTVVAFFAVFLVHLARPSVRKTGAADEALGMALGIGSLLSFAGMIMASQAGEVAACQLHATELLMLLGTVIVLLVPSRDAARATA